MVDHILRASQEQHKKITIMYQHGENITQRDILVLGMDKERVKAMCYLRHQPRIFRKSNILAADYTKKH